VGSQNTPDSCMLNSAKFSIRELLVAFAGIAGILGGFKTAGWFTASGIALAFGILLIVRGHNTERVWEYDGLDAVDPIGLHFWI
jgi:hypothetical protein